MTIAVVVPSNRPDRLKAFRNSWWQLLAKHNATLIEVIDGDIPRLGIRDKSSDQEIRPSPEKWSDEWNDLIYTHNDGVRNLGFLSAAKYIPDLKIIITLDDDVIPYNGNDPIQEHLDALADYVHAVWMPTTHPFPRGFPYKCDRLPVWVSHGVWQGIHDYDAPTQLVAGNPPAEFVKGAIASGCLAPICGMNLAFKIEALPYMYFAPMGPKVGVHRFADIWMGVNMKQALDKLNKAVVTGYSTVYHEKASNVFVNLEREAKGIRWNETFWRKDCDWEADPEMKAYFEMYADKRLEWENVCFDILKKRD